MNKIFVYTNGRYTHLRLYGMSIHFYKTKIIIFENMLQEKLLFSKIRILLILSAFLAYQINL